MTGVELIAIERQEQITKHGRFIDDDYKYNTNHQLTKAAMRLLMDLPIIQNPPENWNSDMWEHMATKSFYKRLIIAGALIAAAIDRENYAKIHD